MQKITRNTFEKGLNTDQEVSKIQPVQYTDAHNVELVGDGDFFSLKNIKGTTNVQNVLTGTNVNVIGVFENTYDINGQKKKCLTIFTVEDDLSVNAESASYNLTGNAVNLVRSAPPGSKTMTASAGTFTFTGNTVDQTTVTVYIIKGLESFSGDACSLIDLSSGGSFVYSQISELANFVQGDILYSDSNLQYPFSGAGIGSFYKIRRYSGTPTTYSTEVESDGSIYSLNSCV